MKKLVILFSGMFTCAIVGAQTPVSITNTTLNYIQDFNTLDTITTAPFNTNLPTGWKLLESGPNADSIYRAGKGTSTTGDTYSFGSSASDRALGGIASANILPGFGVAFSNNTGLTISSLNISYQGEQWRLGSTTSATDTLKLMYSTNAASLTDATASWTTVYTASFTSVLTSGSNGSLDGNLNNMQIIDTINVSIPDGSAFYMKWVDVNISGSDDALAIDDLSVTFTTDTITTNVKHNDKVPHSYVSGIVTNNELILTLNVVEGKYNLIINDLSGKMVFANVLTLPQGACQKTISGLNLPGGIYMLRLYNQSSMHQAKININ